MDNLDRAYNQLRRKFSSGEDIHWVEERERLTELVSSGIAFSGRKHVFQKINKYFGHNKGITVLDFGCGGGQTVIYLQLLGYGKVLGVGITSQADNIAFARGMGIDDAVFFEYDQKTLPFMDQSFDLVFSEQVLEHVFDVDNYYREAARVLKKGGLAYFSFPHRMIPFDSHSRTWFIHFFPPWMRRYLFSMVKRDPDHYERELNFKTKGYHKKIASKYFSRVSNETKERLLSFDEQDLLRYEGNVSLRGAIDRVIKSRISGPLLLPLLCQASNVDLCLFK
jgi:SAM-dependent methyltransferase